MDGIQNVSLDWNSERGSPGGSVCASGTRVFHQGLNVVRGRPNHVIIRHTLGVGMR